MTRKRVLVVDDLTPAVAALLRESFDVVGMVSDGQAALESALKLSPDLIVLAMSMPGMSGIEVAQELKRRGNNAKIVFLTVHEVGHPCDRSCSGRTRLRSEGAHGY